MRGPHLRPEIKSVVAILCASCFLTMSIGSVSRAIAADTWETYPRKKTVPDVAPNPETDANRAAEAEAGEAAEKKTAKKKPSGTTWWIAAGAAVVIGIGIAIASGSGGGGGSTNPGHQ